MNTFLPFASYAESAACLDRLRLGKQRLEVLQLLIANSVPSVQKGWVNHPCTIAWRGYTESLVDYGEAICIEWITRGYNDNCLSQIRAFRTSRTGKPAARPAWTMDRAVHIMYRARLMHKDPSFYASKFVDAITLIPLAETDWDLIRKVRGAHACA